jgi:hypothetical protein
MIGDRALKVLKPVDLGFLDHRDRDARRRACHREVEVNRRFAPDVYLGVLDIVDEDGRPRDHVIEMRRLPAARRLSVLLAGVEAPRLVRDVAIVVADIHAAAPSTAAAARWGTPERVRTNWEDGIAQVERDAGGVIPQADRDRAARLARRYLAGRERLLERRIEQGWVRDGHGDLLADDVFCLEDGPRLIDCLAFDDRLRCADVLLDVCFLAMDLEARGWPGLAAFLLGTWADRLGETHPASLADHYIAYRAHVRAKVALLRHLQGQPSAAGQAQRLHDLALRHLERGRVRAVLVGGGPGTGKSTVAAELAGRTGWSVLRSDEVRRDLFEAPPGAAGPARYREGRYDAHHTARVYSALLEQARERLTLGESVILDASWASEGHRLAARRTAAAALGDLVEIRCDAPSDVAARRIASRRAHGRDPSEATPAIARRMAADADPWPQGHPLATDRPLPETAADALRLVEVGRDGRAGELNN